MQWLTGHPLGPLHSIDELLTACAAGSFQGLAQKSMNVHLTILCEPTQNPQICQVGSSPPARRVICISCRAPDIMDIPAIVLWPKLLGIKPSHVSALVQHSGEDLLAFACT